MAKASSGVTGCFGCALALDCITTTLALAGLMQTFGAGCAFGGVFGAGLGLGAGGTGARPGTLGGGGGGGGGAGPPTSCQWLL